MSFPATLITPEMIAALEAAVVSGTLEVSWDSGGVRQRQVYQSVSSMLAALAYAKGRLCEGTAGERVPSTLGVFLRD